MTKVHHLVEQLIDNDEVIPDTLLLQLFKVFCEDLDDLVQEKEELGGIGVSFREGEEIEVVVSYVQILYIEAQVSYVRSRGCGGRSRIMELEGSVR